MSGPAAAPAPPLGSTQRRQIAWITVGAIAVFVTLRLLPTGTNLSHMDFRVEARNANAIEFCDPLNPQFIPVVAMTSPVTMKLVTATPLAIGREARCTVVLRTASGKPIAPEDLIVAHTKKLHLLIIDPTLADYQHVHPEPRGKGEWAFAFTPRASGQYRIFADFTPAATGRGLYASTEVNVLGGAADQLFLMPPEPTPYRFTLTPGKPVLRAGEAIDLVFRVVRADGGGVPLQPVMGAFAHLVAFDKARSGFAHLHPMEIDLAKPPDATHPTLNFKVTIPKPGPYVIWAQVNLAGKEQFVPFWFEVI